MPDPAEDSLSARPNNENDIHNSADKPTAVVTTTFNYRSAIENSARALTPTYDPESNTGGVKLRQGTIVFDTKLKGRLESEAQATINTRKQSLHRDQYTDINGDAIKRVGNFCAKTIRNPGVGEWTYYSFCPRPADKVRRFGREIQ